MANNMNLRVAVARAQLKRSFGDTRRKTGCIFLVMALVALELSSLLVKKLG